jgi:hypothetical protein
MNGMISPYSQGTDWEPTCLKAPASLPPYCLVANKQVKAAVESWFSPKSKRLFVFIIGFLMDFNYF